MWQNEGQAFTVPKPPPSTIFTNRQPHWVSPRPSVSLRCFQIRSTGHQSAQPGAFSPAAL